MLLYENQNISKYIYYLVDDPLSEVDVPIDLKANGNFILTLMDNTILTEEKVRIFLNPVLGDLERIPLGEITYEIDIVIPNSKWILNGMGQFRAYRIMDEFSKLVDGKNVGGIGEVNITKFKAFGITDTSYSCLSALIKVNVATIKSGV
jgi:hypothetical protein